MLGLDVQRLQRVGVGGVAGLGALGLGHVELVEEHHLQLLGRAEVDLLADDGVGLLGRGAHLGGEVLLQRLEVLAVHSDAEGLHPGEQVHEWQLDLGHELGPAVLLDGGVERLGEVQNRPRVQHRGVGGGAVALVPEGVEAELPVVGLPLLQLALEVAQGQVGEVVGALVGPHEVRRDRGVALQAGQRPPAGRERQHRALRVVQDLGPRGVGEPGGDRGVVGGGHLGRVEPGSRAVRGGQGERPDLARACSPGPLHRHAGRDVAGSVLGQPGADLVGAQAGAGQLEAGVVDDVLLRAQRLEEPVAQHPELQAVEERVHGLAVPRTQREVARVQLEVEVTDQGVEASVAHDVAEVLAQRLALLAGDLVGVVDHAVEVAVGLEPLGREPLTDPGHAGEVVGGLPDDGGQLRVLVRRDGVLRLDGLGRHPREVGDPAHGVEHRGAVGDQLQGVAVPGEDQHLHLRLRQCLGHQRGDDVVGLEAVLLQEGDVERVEDLLDQRQLAGELAGGLVPLRLVLGVLLHAEGLARDVEGHRDVRRLLVAQHVDQHRGEAVDGVGVLPRRGGEVLHREREEGAVGQRVAVEQQEPGAGVRLGHPPRLSVATDIPAGRWRLG